MKTIEVNLPYPDFWGTRFHYPIYPIDRDFSKQSAMLHFVSMDRQDFFIDFAISYLQVSIWQGEFEGVLYQAWRWFYGSKPSHLWTVTNEKPTPPGY